jgi:energy-coupling factor transporter ATP-binding protein EcfA2
MTDYRRTRIRRLAVRGFRSLRDVQLDDLPDIVVLHGPNGSGKSNLLRAIQLLLHAISFPDDLPAKREDALSMTLEEAQRRLDLRPDDFHRGAVREIRIGMEIELGTRAHTILGGETARTLQRLVVDAVFQDVGDERLLFWCQRADIDGTLRISRSDNANILATRHNIAQLRMQRTTCVDQIETYRGQISAQPNAQARMQIESAYKVAIKQQTSQIGQFDDQIRKLEHSLGEQELLADRVRLVLCRQLIQSHEAYRVPGLDGGLESNLQRTLLSDDPANIDAMDRLGAQLAKVQLFGPAIQPVHLRPVENSTGERQVKFLRPNHGWLPLRNLGTGEQQVIFMLANSVITRHPIAHLEEPEAHLHPELMEPLAQFLRNIILSNDRQPEVDQLWMATHHHMFAIYPTYIDVSLDHDGSTQVNVKPRAEAIKHFYEPGPFWDALRDLIRDGVSESSVVGRTQDGKPIVAKEVVESIESGDGKLAREFAQNATRSVLLALRRRESAE